MTTSRICSAAFSLGFTCLRLIPRQHAEQIGRDQDLAVAIRAGADADGGDRKSLREFSRRRAAVTNSSTIGKAPACTSASASASKLLLFRFLFAFDVVAAFLEHMLRQACQVAEERNAGAR